MKTILASIGAKYIHKTLAPWCLKAYCDAQNDCGDIIVREYNVNNNHTAILGDICAQNPDILGFSCYIWNMDLIVRLISSLRELLPRCIIVLGGPEVSFVKNIPVSIRRFCDYIIQGEGEISFYRLIRTLIRGDTPQNRIIQNTGCSHFPDFPSPFTETFFNSFIVNGKNTISNHLVYYESARGCPFSCAYCLSSATSDLLFLPLHRVKSDLALLVARGATCIKFVDRTFNANKYRALEILEYIYTLQTDCKFHFEVAADLFDDDLFEIISQMPPTRVQFEIGIQSTNPETLNAVSRKTNTALVLENIRRLAGFQNCHIHVDLIALLPHETLATFRKGFDETMATRPHMLQLGFLKMLKGSRIRQESLRYRYIFLRHPPYEALASHCMTFSETMLLKGIEETVDKFYNSGLFFHSINYALGDLFESAFDFFRQLWLYAKVRDGTKISLKNAYELLMNFLLQFGNTDAVYHFIKLDCLTYDAKYEKPRAIPSLRDKEAERDFRRNSTENYTNITVEYFPYDDKTRIFIYDVRNPITKAYLTLDY